MKFLAHLVLGGCLHTPEMSQERNDTTLTVRMQVLFQVSS